MHYSPLLTDLYQLTMLAGYCEEGMADKPAVFDLFFRKNPFEGGYAIFAGLEPALEYLENLHFRSKELEYLQKTGIFSPNFLDFLSDFRFHGTVTAPPEGTVVFANEPLLTVAGNLAEVQFVETALLNIINFQTLIASKAARIVHAAAGAPVIEFGLRRAQGPNGALSAARAASVGGVRSTSNVLAGMVFDLPVSGTHAHSWVQAFPDELSAFRAYAAAFPDSTILLVDTYDTLRSGVPNAIIIARELRAQGHELRAVRLDSGDLAFLSRASRQLFDAAGFPAVKIVASNELDEYVISSIREEGGEVDIYGVGTQLATGGGRGGGALGGVYKLVEISGEAKLKITSDITKATLPGRKRLLRVLNREGGFIQDVISLEGSAPGPGSIVYDPNNPLQHTTLPPEMTFQELRRVVMKDGRRNEEAESLNVMAERSAAQLALLPQGCLRFIHPHLYKVSICSELNELRNTLIEQLRRRMDHE